MKKIRFALVRCDTHGYWYCAVFAACDGTPRWNRRAESIVTEGGLNKCEWSS